MEAELCNCILEEHFGSLVAKVAKALLREPGPLPILASRLKGQVNLTQIRKSLVVLEQFGIVSFKLDASMRVQYALDIDAVLALAKAPRCLYIVKTHYDALGEFVFLEIFYNGRLTCSETLRRVAATNSVAISQVKEKFCRLAESQFIIRCPPIESSLKGCPQFSTSYDQFIMPDLILQDTKENGATGSDVEDSSRKRKAAAPDRDADIYWRINWSRFDRHIRDDMVLELLVPKNSPNGARWISVCQQTVTAILKANETRSSSLTANSSAPIAVMDIMRCVRDHGLTVERNDVEWALRCLTEDSRGVLRKAGDSGGGLFLIDFERAVNLISQAHIESLIREQLETKAVRIFRLLQARGHLEEDHIEKLTMLSSKETRELLYAMMDEGYVFNKPVGRTNDFTPARTFYLYNVNMPRTVRGLVEYTCKMMRNLMMRRKHEDEQHKRLTDRKLMVLDIIDQIRADATKDEETTEQECLEVEETYLPAADKAKLEQFIKANTLMMSSECELERTLFTLRLYMRFALRHC